MQSRDKISITALTKDLILGERLTSDLTLMLKGLNFLFSIARRILGVPGNGPDDSWKQEAPGCPQALGPAQGLRNTRSCLAARSGPLDFKGDLSLGSEGHR